MTLKKVALFCALAFATNAMADVEVKDTNNFNDVAAKVNQLKDCLLYTSPSPRDY